MVIKIESVGEEKFIRGFSRFIHAGSNLKPAFNEVVQDFYRVNRHNFAAQGTPEKFKPLSPRYARWKRKHYPGKKILRLTGRLMNSLIGQNQADAQDTVRDIRQQYAEFGTGVPYANRQYRNGRKPVQLTEATKRRWASIIHEFVFHQIKEAL